MLESEQEKEQTWRRENVRAEKKVVEEHFPTMEVSLKGGEIIMMRVGERKPAIYKV